MSPAEPEPIIPESSLFSRLLRSLLYTFLNTFVQAFYHVRTHHAERQPKTGAVLILPNHTSYADALMVGSVCERKVRFVMFDEIYEMKALKWGFDAFGTVPISRTKAKEAIRAVADALKQQEAIVLYPEGQLTRTGFLNEIRKGYELMARMGGKSVVQPVWIDGLWGSIFSFEGGRFFKKRPKAIPYPLSVWFGEVMEAKEATSEKVHEAICKLSAEAFANREIIKKAPSFAHHNGIALTDEEAQVAHVNAVRLLDTILLRSDDIVLCLLPEDHMISKTFCIALPELMDIEVIWKDAEIIKNEDQRVLVIGDAASLKANNIAHDLAIEVVSEIPAPGATLETSDSHLPLYFDPVTGVILALSVPDPVMPEEEVGLQLGRKPGSVGHLMGGLSFHREEGALTIGDLLPGKEVSVRLTNAKIDAEGFLLGC